MLEYEQTILDVEKNAIRDGQDLVRGEIALAKSELRGELKRMAPGAGCTKMSNSSSISCRSTVASTQEANSLGEQSCATTDRIHASETVGSNLTEYSRWFVMALG